MSQPTMWEKVKSGSKAGFDKAYAAVDKLGPPINRLSNKVGSEAFWPTTLDKESDKAARILKSFCKDGFYTEEETQPADGPKQKQKVIKKIPTEVIKRAKGLAIFTTMRTGLWFSGAGGSGILVARKEDGTWSPPSGIMLHTAGLGFLVGIDIYDCVVVINTDEALQAFTKIRCTLGGEVSATAGPVGMGGVMETEVHKRQYPLFTYMKSRGFYAGVQIDGTVIIERTDENENFYNERIGVTDILKGKARNVPHRDLRQLWETLKAAQGDQNIDESMLPEGPPPGDYEIEDGHIFGIPEKDDPDPYGVLALEKEGMNVVEAGTKKRASWEQFTFSPSPTSPVHNIQASRSSTDLSKRGSWRNSAMSSVVRNGEIVGGDTKRPSSLRNSLDSPRPGYANSATQTDDDGSRSPPRGSFRGDGSRRTSRSSVGSRGPVIQDAPESATAKQEVNTTNGYTTPPHTPPRFSTDDHDDATVHSVETGTPVRQISAQRIQKATIVSVPKRGPPPKLPPRNPNRSGPALVGSPATEESAEAAAEPPSEVSVRSRSTSPIKEAQTSNENAVESKMSNVNIDDSDDEITQRDPWANVKEKRTSAASNDSAKMPGGFE